MCEWRVRSRKIPHPSSTHCASTMLIPICFHRVLVHRTGLEEEVCKCSTSRQSMFRERHGSIQVKALTLACFAVLSCPYLLVFSTVPVYVLRRYARNHMSIIPSEGKSCCCLDNARLAQMMETDATRKLIITADFTNTFQISSSIFPRSGLSTSTMALA